MSYAARAVETGLLNIQLRRDLASSLCFRNESEIQLLEAMMSRLQRIRYKIMRTKVRAPLIWIRHRGLNSSDVFLASYPKSGSTWLRFQLFEILTSLSAGF